MAWTTAISARISLFCSDTDDGCTGRKTNLTFYNSYYFITILRAIGKFRNDTMTVVSAQNAMAKSAAKLEKHINLLKYTIFCMSVVILVSKFLIYVNLRFCFNYYFGRLLTSFWCDFINIYIYLRIDSGGKNYNISTLSFKEFSFGKDHDLQ